MEEVWPQNGSVWGYLLWKGLVLEGLVLEGTGISRKLLRCEAEENMERGTWPCEASRSR